MTENPVYVFSTLLIPVLLAITLHEAAHGYIANHFGDPTAKNQGRLSLNPIRHIDPFGTLIMPIMLFFLGGFIFGYAKPVPVNTWNLRDPRWDMVWVALAGPAANIFLAFAGSLLFFTTGFLPAGAAQWWAANLEFLIFFNCIIAIFNMLPVPPLDGSRVIAAFMPREMAYRFAGLDRFGLLFVLGIFFILPFFLVQGGVNFDLGRFLIFDPAYRLYTFFLGLFN